jgi:uncharacterized protein YmfQ (DUF2313 family)
MSWTQLSTVDYQQALNNLLPTGDAWPREFNSSIALQEVIAGLVTIYGDPTTSVEQLAALLLQTESDPRKANVLLPDWETAFGLPDICLPRSSGLTIAQRQQSLVNKITFLGAQSRAFFIAQAALNGQTVSLTEYAPYQCGISGVGNTTNLTDDGTYRWGLGREEIRFVWVVAPTALTASFNGADLFCFMNRWKPAHTEVTFDYSALAEFRFSRPWNSGLLATL